MRAVLNKIPATVITGFLGAGKTTLIQHMLQNANGKRIALIINEFGDMGVDREVLRGCGLKACEGDEPEDDGIVELANGCLCCTVADEFLPAMEALVAREPRPDHIVIETSGLALPKPLLKAFDWPAIRSRVTVDGVVTVVDGHAFAAGQFADDIEAVEAQRRSDESLDHDNPLEELFLDQLACADMVVVNKVDLLDDGRAETALAELQGKLRAGVNYVVSDMGKVDPTVLLGLDAAAEDDLDARHSHHDHHHHDDDHDHDHDDHDDHDHHHGHDHDHDDFTSFAVRLGDIADPQALEDKLVAVIAKHGILRVKGFLDVPGKPMRHVVQGVGVRIRRYFDRPWKPDEDRRSELVVIGLAGLDEAAIRQELAG